MKHVKILGAFEYMNFGCASIIYAFGCPVYKRVGSVFWVFGFVFGKN
jgi:hypothetical protein